MSTKEFHLGTIDIADGGNVLKTDLQFAPVNYPVYFRVNNLHLTRIIEPFLALAFLPCMKEGRALVAEGKVSQRLLKAIPTICDIFCLWEPSFRRVKIKGIIPEKKTVPQEHRVGTFFSGGVDSFYTLLKHRQEITDLIFVHGYDIGLEDHVLYKKTLDMVHKVAAHFGKQVIEVETNLRSFLDGYVPWFPLGHGVGLASVGLLLSPFSNEYIFLLLIHISISTLAALTLSWIPYGARKPLNSYTMAARPPEWTR